MRRRMLRLRLLGLRMSWLRFVQRTALGRGARAHLFGRRRVRTLAAIAAIIGLVATAAGIQATAASWTDSVSFGIEVSTATSTTTTTTTPEILASVRVTAICKNQNTYRLRVDNDSDQTLDFTLQAGGSVISGPHTIDGGASQEYDIPNGTSDVTAVPAGAWTNTSTSTASMPTTNCQAPTTTTTTPPPTTTQPPPPPPPPPSVWPGGISAGNDSTVIADITWDVTRVRHACTVVSVTGIDSTPRHWELLIDLSTAPWYGTAASRLVVSGSGTLTVVNATTVRITGRSNPGNFNSRTNNTPITNTQIALFEICNHQSPEPRPGDPSWYSVTTSPSGTWTTTTACLDLRVTSLRNDLETYPFYFGWTARVDLSGAVTHLGEDRSLRITFVPKPNGSNDYSVEPGENPYTYIITNGYDSALRAIGGGADSFSTTVCVNAT
jgi:hypothetical protein